MSQEIADYLDLIKRQRAGLLQAVAGLPVEALDWTPLPRDTSSIAVLAHHCAGVVRLWCVEGLAGRDTHRDRAAEFAAGGKNAAVLADLINAAYDESEAAVRDVDPAVLDRAQPLTLNHDRRGETHTGRFCITTAVGHVAEHIGHMQLTRQLWEARHT